MKPRLISFAGSTVAVEYEGVRAAHIVEFLYQDQPDANTGTPHCTCRLVSDAKSDALLLYEEGEPAPRRFASDGGAAAYLLDRTGYHLADRSQGGLLFHAAGVRWNQQGLLFPGRTGCGKSTLTLWLLSKGCHYLTDELIFVPTNGGEFHGFTRPINLKRTARPLLAQLFDVERLRDQMISSPQIDLIPPALLGPHSPLHQAPLSLIIFPSYKPDHDFSLEKLSKAKAGLELMKCLVNARNLPQHGFRELVTIANDTPAYSMTYRSFEQVEEELPALLAH